MDTIIGVCQKFGRIILDLSDAKHSMFSIDEHMKKPNGLLRELVARFKGDTSQCKMMLTKYSIWMTAILKNLEVRVSR